MTDLGSVEFAPKRDRFAKDGASLGSLMLLWFTHSAHVASL